MLVLSRKIGERVLIGDNVTLTVLEVKGRQVRLGFEAPQSVSIWRGELEFQDRKIHHETELVGAN
jgi:carbon storage regulator